MSNRLLDNFHVVNRARVVHVATTFHGNPAWNWVVCRGLTKDAETLRDVQPITCMVCLWSYLAWTAERSR